MIGKTEKSGWQVGVRKTLPLSQKALWEFITSAQGMKFLTGDTLPFQNVKNDLQTSRNGIQYKITTFVESSHFRMQWKFQNWNQHSILQIRIIGSGENKSVLAIHQEKLADENARSEMKKYWQDKINVITNVVKVA